MLTTSASRVTHVLYLEDKLGISSVIRSHLQKYPDICLEKVATPEDALAKMAAPEFDTIITSIDHPYLEKRAIQLGVDVVSVKSHGKILPFSVCSKISEDKIVVEDRESIVEFYLHRRRNVRKQLQEIIAYIHDLVIYRAGISTIGSDIWLLADMMESSKTAVAVVHGNSFQWCNAQAIKMLGFSHNDIKNHQLSDLFRNRDEYVQFSREIQRNRGQNGWGQASAALVKKGGGTVACSVQMRRVDPGHPLKGHILCIRDLSEDEKNEEQIREILNRVKANEAQFREALDNVNAIIIRTDPDGTILFSNQSLKQCLGYEPGELLGKSIMGTIFPETSRIGKEAALLNTQSGPVSNGLSACQTPTKKGDRIWIAWNTIALPCLGNDAEEMLFIGYDISDHKAEQSSTMRTNPWKYQLLEGTDIDEEIFDAVFHICVELSVDGREGRHVGTAFSIGDSARVLSYSRQCGINAYAGQDRAVRCVRNSGNKEAIKGLAQLDGAFVVGGNGLIEASCRHFITDTRDIQIPVGYGTRHSSMAGMTQMTKAVGIVVSESGGTISVFKDGNIVRRFSL